MSMFNVVLSLFEIFRDITSRRVTDGFDIRAPIFKPLSIRIKAASDYSIYGTFVCCASRQSPKQLQPSRD